MQNSELAVNSAPQVSSRRELDILYQDDYLVAVQKPSGLLVHRSWLDSAATEFALQIVRDQVGQHVYPAHRLDRPTSGVLLFALSGEVAALMAQQFSGRLMDKSYLALVRGYLGDGELDYALKEELDKIADKQADANKPAQEAVTQFRCLGQAELPFAVGRYPTSRYSLMYLSPKTGRKHQLRRHMAHLRHPIVGDTSHGDGKHNRFFREHFGNDRLLLHAASLAFEHPVTKQSIKIDAPLDPSFIHILQAMGLDNIAS